MQVKQQWSSAVSGNAVSGKAVSGSVVDAIPPAVWRRYKCQEWLKLVIHHSMRSLLHKLGIAQKNKTKQNIYKNNQYQLIWPVTAPAIVGHQKLHFQPRLH